MRGASLPAVCALVVLCGFEAHAATPPPHARPHVANAVPAAPPIEGPDARPLIIAAVAASSHVSFVGQVSSIRSGTSTALAVISKVEHRAPDETRRTYLAPRALYGQFVVSRGSTSWDVDGNRKRVVVTENKAAFDPVAIVDDIALLDGNYRAVRTAAGDVADRPADVVDLVSRYTGERAMRLWIDSETHVVLAKEAYHSDGSLAWRIRFDDIRYTDDIPQQIFSESVPSGYATVHGRSYDQPHALPSAVPDAGFEPIRPKYLPDGFTLVGADVTAVNGVRNLHLIYSDGIRTLSLFENDTNRTTDFGAMPTHTTSFEGHEARYTHDGPTTLLAWREHHLAFALVGDQDLKELVAIGTSVVP